MLSLCCLDRGCAMCRGAGPGDRLLGLRKSFSPASQVQFGFPKGQWFREVWGRAEECSAGPLGRGQERPTASQDFHCVLPTPAAPPPSGPGPGELLQEQNPREGKGEEGQALVETEPERREAAVGEGGPDMPSHKGLGGGLHCMGPFLNKEGQERREKQKAAKPGQG